MKTFRNTTIAFALLLTGLPCLGQINANFSSNVTSGCAPLTVEFIDQSTPLMVNAWNWDFGDTGTSTDANPTHTYNVPGDYTVTLIASQVGIVFTLHDTITKVNYITTTGLSVTETITDDFCNRGDGVINLAVSGGQTPYFVMWSNGDSTLITDGLTQGSYTVVIEDMSGCRFQETYQVGNSNNNLQISLVNVTDESSPGANDGAIDVSVTGGSPPYSYNWVTNGASTEDISGLAAGQYCLLVTDANGCIEDGCFTVGGIGCTNFSVTGQVTHIGCNGIPSGAIDLTVTGGVPPYYYIWSNGSNDQDITNVAGGNYSVTVEDSSSCREVVSFYVGYGGGFQISGTVVAATPGAADGIIEVSVNGGVAPYEYSWDGGTTYISWHIHDNLAPGTYCVLVRDSNNCIEDLCFTVGAGGCGNFALTGTVSNASCNLSDGSVLISISGGNPPYDIAWSNGDDDPFVDNLAPGTYVVEIEDSLGCTLRETFTVSRNPGYQYSGSVTNVSTPFGNDGAIDLTVSGGTPPYNYIWSNGDSTQDLTGLTAGTYCVVISDSTGCLEDPCFIVEGAGCSNFSITGQVTHLGCNNSPPGAIDLSVSGGLPPYYFLWSNGSDDEDISNLAAGNYSVTVEDSSTCREDMTFTVGYAGGFQLSGAVTDATLGAADGMIEVFVNGGTAPYQYSWNGGITYVTWPIHDNLSPGSYCVLVQDSAGCIEDLCFTVGVQGCGNFEVTAWNDIYLCDTGTTILEANAFNGTLPYSYQWTATPALGTVISNPRDRLTNVTISGTTDFFMVVTDSNGCIATDTVTVFVSGALSMGVTWDSLSVCAGDSVRLEAFGGGDYFWNPSGTLTDPRNNDPIAFPSVSTTYFVTISNTSCSETFTVYVDIDDCVWPGDANNDGIADNNDILSLGIAYNISGPTRLNATINWKAQPAPDWPLQFAGGANLKHADCNGDGIINVNDTTAVSQNYGLTHAKGGRNGKMTDPALYFEIPDDTVLAGTQVDVSIYLGRDSLPVSNFYGIAFSANYNNSLVEEGTMVFQGTGSWAGTPGLDLLNFSKDLNDQSKIDIAQTRIDGNTVSGFGQLGVLSFTMKDDISGKELIVRAMNLTLDNIKAISNDEIEIDIFEGESTIYVVKEITGIIERSDISNALKVYPNPSNNKVFVDPGKLTIERFSIVNILGQERFVKALDVKEIIELDMSSLDPGNYFMKLETNEGVAVKRIVIQ